MKVVITDWDLGGREPLLRILGPAGLKPVFAECESAADVAAAGKGAEALMVRSAPVPAEALDGLDTVQFISRMGIGPWGVDLEAAIERHVAVADCPEYCTEEAVAHTLALILALNRRLDTVRDAARDGLWRTYGELGEVRPPSSLTLGLIGLGRMGRGVARAALTLRMAVLAYDPGVLGGPDGVELVPLDTVLAESDVLCLACNETPETRHLINANTLASVKPGALLINTARGSLVDEQALIDALDSGRLAGAALDVLEEEPPPADHPLLQRPDVWLTPHVAHYSEQSRHELKVHAARTVVHYLTGERVGSLLTPDFRRV